MIETQYQRQGPFLLDSNAATVALGIEPTSTDVALRETIDGIRTRALPEAGPRAKRPGSALG